LVAHLPGFSPTNSAANGSLEVEEHMGPILPAIIAFIGDRSARVKIRGVADIDPTFFLLHP